MKTSDQEKAREYVLRLLQYRERSRQEIEDRLKRKNFNCPTIRDTVAHFIRLNLLNDERFARLWVRSRLDHRPRSARFIRQELRQKGVAEEVIKTVLTELIPPGGERAAALALARKQFRTYARRDPAGARRKLSAYLARWGFSLDLVDSVIKEIEAE